jgi:Rad3-related DNA helicase
MEQAQHPVNRLDQIMAAATCREAADIRAEIARLRDTHEAEVADWVEAGATGARPTPSAELLAAERRLGEIAGKVAEAQTVIPIAQEDYVAAAERARNVMRERDQALWPAAAEAAEPMLEELEQAIEGVLHLEAPLHSLISALREIGHRDPTNGNGALGAAERVEKAIVTAHRRPAARSDVAIGHSFLDRLRSDAWAAL